MKKRVSLSNRLIQADTILNNILSTEDIFNELVLYGYDKEKLNSTLKLVGEVRELDNRQQREYAEQYQASDNFEQALNSFYKTYMRSLKIARLAFGDHTEARVALLLDGIRQQSFGGIQKQAEAFYGNLITNPEYLKTINRFNLTADMLQQQYTALKELVTLSNLHQKEKGEAVEATRNRDEKADQLDKFIAELVKICKIAFDEVPQNLKMIGVTV